MMTTLLDKVRKGETEAAATVTAAIAKVEEKRAVYQAENEKLQRLFAKRDEIEREIEALASAPKDEGWGDERVDALLAGHTAEPSPEETIARLRANSHELGQAIAFQQRVIDQLRRAFEIEAAEALRPAHAAIVTRMVSAVRALAQVESEEQALFDAMAEHGVRPWGRITQAGIPGMHGRGNAGFGREDDPSSLLHQWLRDLARWGYCEGPRQ